MSFLELKDVCHLQGKIRILLNGRDVTDLCNGFDTEGAVRLLELNDKGARFIRFFCACGERRTGDGSGPVISPCRKCRQEVRSELAQKMHFGKVEVFPVNPTAAEI